jgi:hypothetical protein
MPNTTALTPAKQRQVAASGAKKKSERFIQILRDDHNYDIVAEIIKHMAEIKRAKKIKPLEKHRLLKDYHITLLSYCLPKIKIQETTDDGSGKGVIFNINIGGDDPAAGPKKAGKGRVSNTGVNIKIPTKQNKDGSISVSGD